MFGVWLKKEKKLFWWSSSLSSLLSSVRISSRSLYSDFEFAATNMELVKNLWVRNLDVESYILIDSYGFLLNHSSILGLVTFSRLNSCPHFVLNFLANVGWKLKTVIMAYFQHEIHGRENWEKNLRRIKNLWSLSDTRAFCW